VRGDRGKAFENLVALCLLKLQSRLEDRDGRNRWLRYIRTKEGREVDFLLVDEDSPKAMIEAKWGDREPSPQLRYFRDRYPIEAIQLVAELRQDYDSGGIALRRAAGWLGALET